METQDLRWHEWSEGVYEEGADGWESGFALARGGVFRVGSVSKRN